jgi:hypothetical protein
MRVGYLDALLAIETPSGAAAKLGCRELTLDSKIKSLKISKNQFKTALRAFVTSRLFVIQLSTNPSIVSNLRLAL